MHLFGQTRLATLRCATSGVCWSTVVVVVPVVVGASGTRRRVVSVGPSASPLPRPGLTTFPGTFQPSRSIFPQCDTFASPLSCLYESGMRLTQMDILDGRSTQYILWPLVGVLEKVTLIAWSCEKKPETHKHVIFKPLTPKHVTLNHVTLKPVTLKPVITSHVSKTLCHTVMWARSLRLENVCCQICKLPNDSGFYKTGFNSSLITTFAAT